MEFYRKKYLLIKNQINNKGKSMQYLKKRNLILQKTVSKLKDKIKVLSISELIDKLDVSENEKVFSKMLLKTRRCTNASWNNDEKLFAQSIYYRSTSTYLFLRTTLNLNLPSISSLRRWTEIKNLQPGNNLCIFEALKNAFQKMNPIDAECVLIFDEICIRKDLKYNNAADVIDGVEDMGYKRTNEIGGQICVFMLRGLFTNWKFVLNYFVTAKSIKGKDLKILIEMNLDLVAKIGLKVRAIICDQGPNNCNCFSIFGAIINNPYFCYDERRIYLLYDTPQLFKSIRNALLKANFETPDGTVCFDVVKEILQLENQNVTRMTKLTPSHIQPTNFEKMRVHLAVQTLSHSVAAAIETVNETKNFKRNSSSIANSTAKFIEKMNICFDCLNSKTLNTGLKSENYVYTQLQDLTKYLKEIKYNGNKIFCIDGLIQTINGVLSLAKDVFDENTDLFCLLTGRLNQDPLENTFSYLRAKGGNCRNPSVYEFNLIMAKLISLRLMHFNTNSNCSEDDDVMLAVNFKSILEETQQDNYITNQTPSSNFNIQEVVNDNVEYFDSQRDSFTSSSIPIELTSSRYFVGYIASRINCEKCKADIIKPCEILTYPSEILINKKNYRQQTDFGNLCAPSDTFFDICKIHIKVFEKIFIQEKHMKGIREYMFQKCIECTKDTIYEFWFNEKNVCYSHRKQMLHLLLTTLLHKHCSWARKADVQSKMDKVKILSHK